MVHNKYYIVLASISGSDGDTNFMNAYKLPDENREALLLSTNLKLRVMDDWILV